MEEAAVPDSPRKMWRFMDTFDMLDTFQAFSILNDFFSDSSPLPQAGEIGEEIIRDTTPCSL